MAVQTRRPTQLNIESVSAKRLLSFGDTGISVKLQQLNVLIGANGSGKSNFLEVLRLLQSAPRDLSKFLSSTGPISDWNWKGGDGPRPGVVIVDVTRTIVNKVVESQVRFAGGVNPRYRHSIMLEPFMHRLKVISESIDSIDGDNPQAFFSSRNGEASISRLSQESSPKRAPGYEPIAELPKGTYNASQSCLSQFTDPLSFPFIFEIAKLYSAIKIYGDTSFGRDSRIRRPVLVETSSDEVDENGDNLALVLNDLQNHREIWYKILDHMREFHPRLREIITHISNGTVQITLDEGLRHTIPAARLSDGTIQYLLLLAVLCNPTPPELICIEEPELGLHPDMIRSVAELLKDASTRTQVVVTTHSDLLVSALSEDPTAILVCEHDGQETQINRLEVDKLNLWLERYSLGELWLRGEIGGNRW